MASKFGARLRSALLVVTIATIASAAPVAAATVGDSVRAVQPGDPIDPSTLTPEPPPGATCFAVNRTSTICNTFLDLGLTREPVFDLPCGKVYETSVDRRDGIRWYVNGKAARRFVHGRISGTWSLSPDATGKKVKISANWSLWTVWPVHGDDATAQGTFYGQHFRATAPGLGLAIFWFGRVDPDGTSHGIKNGFKVAQPPGAEAGVDADDLTDAALAALAKVLC